MKRTPLSRLAWLAAVAMLFPAITLANQAPKTSAMPATAHKWGATAHRIDVNTATREQLMTLPGIDGVAADKIIEGRPWKNGQSLVEKNVLTKADFAKLKSRITARHMPAPAKTK